MVSKEDWNAAMSSEIFREYLAAELQKQAQAKSEPQVDSEEVMDQWDQLESQIQSNPKLVQAFSALRQKFIDDPDYAEQVNPSFVKGVFMLDLPEQD